MDFGPRTKILSGYFVWENHLNIQREAESAFEELLLLFFIQTAVNNIQVFRVDLVESCIVKKLLFD